VSARRIVIRAAVVLVAVVVGINIALLATGNYHYWHTPRQHPKWVDYVAVVYALCAWALAAIGLGLFVTAIRRRRRT
jgi:hypothetical protein